MNFKAIKHNSISKIDFSRKGSIDEPIRELVECINNSENFFTTSSCSGRICLFEENPELETKKKGCIWLYTTHEKIILEQLLEGLKKSNYNASLKFEPFILHVQCREIRDGQLMHQIAIRNGFRNSGISIGKNNKIITAVRSSHMMQVPITRNGISLVSDEYLDYLCELINEKVNINTGLTSKFYKDLKDELTVKKE